MDGFMIYILNLMIQIIPAVTWILLNISTYFFRFYLKYLFWVPSSPKFFGGNKHMLFVFVCLRD